MSSYALLSTEDAEGPSSWPEKYSENKRPPQRSWSLWLSVALNACLVVALFTSWRRRSDCLAPNHFYSPAQDAIQYTPTKFFHSTAYSKTEYFGTGPDVDAAWHALYSSAISSVDATEASMLVDWTQPISVDGQDEYAIELNVFHDLHCLNLLRMSLYPEHYNVSELGEIMSPVHLAHCVDGLRQSTQCHADITPLSARLAPTPQDTPLNFRLDATHMCRDFKRVKEWADARPVSGRYMSEYFKIRNGE
ncbi:hypothetical protein GGX14DRAFT_572390 [Mycena pura]|uniref:Tat pathway signal sequence n=1 Tax=Mycena pura TaxID=153505 RepID=A0AAD6Y589_9AGAR|nr:hypothetical protein GGX14DRAFT_572390 [Mycena pura]